MTGILTERFYLIQCRFRTLKDIKNLPFYAGPHISALFRNLYHLIHGRELPERISITPIIPAGTTIERESTFAVNISVPAECWQEFQKVFTAFNHAQLNSGGHFLPGKTIYLQQCICRITGEDALSSSPKLFSMDHIQDEINHLEGRDKLTLFFYAPLRLKRPAGTKTQGHRFVDIDFLRQNHHPTYAHFVKSIRSVDVPHISYDGIQMVPRILLWVDVTYNSTNHKTIGGIWGKIVILNPPKSSLPLLVLGQYVGAGKNRTFGFGYYFIEESGKERAIITIPDGDGTFSVRTFDPGAPFSSLGINGIKDVFISKPERRIKAYVHLNPEELDKFYNELPEKVKKEFLSVLIPHVEVNQDNISNLRDASVEISQGRPVFLTRFARKVYTQGPHLMAELGTKLKIKVPWSTISHLFVIGKPPVSTGILYRAISSGIPITIMDMTGRTRGMFYPEGYDVPYYTDLQYDTMNNRARRLQFVREIVLAKVHNSSVILRRIGIDTSEFKKISDLIEKSESIDSIRGYEGNASKLFFKHFGSLIEEFGFSTRQYYPPADPVNAMLSFTYSLIHHRLASLLHARGLNPRIGLYHQGRGRHAALASDLMEELRHIAERVVLKVIRRREVSHEEFRIITQKGKEYCEMKRQVVSLLVERFEEVMHTEALTYGGTDVYGYMYKMVENFIQFIKGKSDYRALRIR